MQDAHSPSLGFGNLDPGGLGGGGLLVPEIGDGGGLLVPVVGGGGGLLVPVLGGGGRRDIAFATSTEQHVLYHGLSHSSVDGGSDTWPGTGSDRC